MVKTYKERFIKIVKAINSDILKQHAQLKKQKKLNFEAFSFLNKVYLQDFYSSEEPIL